MEKRLFSLLAIGLSLASFSLQISTEHAFNINYDDENAFQKYTSTSFLVNSLESNSKNSGFSFPNNWDNPKKNALQLQNEAKFFKVNSAERQEINFPKNELSSRNASFDTRQNNDFRRNDKSFNRSSRNFNSARNSPPNDFQSKAFTVTNIEDSPPKPNSFKSEPKSAELGVTKQSDFFLSPKKSQSDFENELSEVKAKLKSSEDERQRLNNQLFDIKDRQNDVGKEKEGLRRQLKDLEGRLLNFEQQLTNEKEQRGRLESRAIEAERRAKELAGQLGDCQSKKGQDRDACDQALSSAKSCALKIDDLQAQNKSLWKANDQLSGEKQALAQKASDSADKIKELKQKVDDLEASAGRVGQQLEAARKNQERCDRLSSDNKEAEKKAQSALSQLGDCQADLSRLNSELSKSANLKGQADDCLSRLSRLQKDFEAASSDKSALLKNKAANDEALASLDAIKGRAKGLEALTFGLKDKLEARESALNDCQAKVTGLQKQLDDSSVCSAKLAELDSSSARLKTSLADLTQQNKDLDASNANLSAKLTEAGKTLATCNSSLSDAKDKLDAQKSDANGRADLEERYKALQLEYDGVKRDLEGKRAAVDKLSYFADRLQSLSEFYSRLKAQTESLQKTKEDLEAKLAQTQSDFLGKLDSCSKETGSLKAVLQSQVPSYDELKAQIAGRDAFVEKCNKSQQALGDLQFQLDKLKKAAEAADASASQCKALQQSLDLSNSQLEGERAEKEELKRKDSENTKQLALLRAQMVDAGSKAKDSDKDQQSALADCKAKSEQLLKQVDFLSFKLSALDQDAKGLRQDNSSLAKSLEELKAKPAAAGSADCDPKKIAELRSQADGLSGRVKDLESQLASLKSDKPKPVDSMPANNTKELETTKRDFNNLEVAYVECRKSLILQMTDERDRPVEKVLIVGSTLGRKLQQFAEVQELLSKR